MTLLPTLALTSAAVIVAVFCRKLLGEANAADAALPSLVPLFLSTLGFTAVAGAVVLYNALHFSHRVAGPAYRLIRSLERVRDGDLQVRVTLRKGDHLVEVADQVNQLVEWLEANPPRVDPVAGNGTSGAHRIRHDDSITAGRP